MKVIVIGAGIAGLAAAKELTGAGIEPLVLEARDRAGGRIYTLLDSRIAAPIELGAEFVHGNPPEIFDLARSAGIDVVETAGNSLFLKNDGTLALAGEEPPGSDNSLWEIAERYIEAGKPDVSFEQFLNLPETSPVSEREKAWTKRFVAGFHAAELNKAGIYGLVKTQKAEEEIGGDTASRIPLGYSALVDFLKEGSETAGAKLYFNKPVTQINWEQTPVRVEAGDQIFEADAAIITLPVGVLKAPPGSQNYVHFVPEITTKHQALNKIEMGCARRVIFAFSEKWWVDVLAELGRAKARLGFLFAQNVPISVWWTNEPARTPLLTGWVGGPKATEMSKLTDRQFIDLAVTSLNRIFRVGESFIESKLVSAFTYDWESDPYSSGAYSYLGVGGIDAPRDFAAPIDDKLYFAGEATSYAGHWGTVHGAIESGIRAAREIIGQL